jgi:hypothetical protein
MLSLTVSGRSLVRERNEPTLWRASNIDHVNMIYHKAVYSADLKRLHFVLQSTCSDSTIQRSSAHDDSLISVVGKRRWWQSLSACLPARKQSVFCNSSIGHWHFFGRTTAGPTIQGVSPQHMARPLFLISTQATFSNEIFVSHRDTWLPCLRMNRISIFVRCSCYLWL